MQINLTSAVFSQIPLIFFNVKNVWGQEKGFGLPGLRALSPPLARPTGRHTDDDVDAPSGQLPGGDLPDPRVRPRWPQSPPCRPWRPIPDTPDVLARD